MSTEELSRGAALAYRAAAHQLDPPAATAGELTVLAVGVQDTPPGTTAHLAMRARLPVAADLDARGLALVHSVRGTMHVHRRADLPLLAAALRPDDAGDLLREAHGSFFTEAAAAGLPVGEALDAVSAAMADVMGDREPRTKGELSTALNAVVDRRLRPWCAGCGVAHVHDGLFRLATLPAGLVLRRHDGETVFHLTKLRTVEPGPARRELLRRFLRLAGPAHHRMLGAWLGITPAAAKRRWAESADDPVPVSVDGTGYAMHPDDLKVARRATAKAEPTKTAHLLPAYDPLLALADRALLVPDAADRRKLWRATANPGAVLIGGEIRGTWRRRRGELTVEPLGALTAAERRVLAQSQGDRQ